MEKLEKTEQKETKQLLRKTASQETLRGKCPECLSEDLTHAGRCTTCMSCGWSACSL